MQILKTTKAQQPGKFLGNGSETRCLRLHAKDMTTTCRFWSIGLGTGNPSSCGLKKLKRSTLKAKTKTTWNCHKLIPNRDLSDFYLIAKQQIWSLWKHLKNSEHGMNNYIWRSQLSPSGTHRPPDDRRLQGFHVGELFGRRQLGHVHPTGMDSMPQVVAFLLDGTEADPTWRYALWIALR